MISQHFPGFHTSHVLGEPIEQCPACGSARMQAVTRELDPKVHCDECGRCWSCQFNGTFRVEPAACPGCRYRAMCFETLRGDLPAFWWAPEA